MLGLDNKKSWKIVNALGGPPPEPKPEQEFSIDSLRPYLWEQRDAKQLLLPKQINKLTHQLHLMKNEVKNEAAA